MKLILTLTLALGSLGIHAQTACEKTAAKAAEREVGGSWHADVSVCKEAPNKKVHICKVIGGFSESSEGSKQFEVVVSKNCKKDMDVRLKLEE